MTQPQLAKIENLDSIPTLPTLNKYAAGLGLQIKWCYISALSGLLFK